MYLFLFVIFAFSLQFETILAVPRPYSGHHLADSFFVADQPEGSGAGAGGSSPSTMVKLASVAMSEKGSTN